MPHSICATYCTLSTIKNRHLRNQSKMAVFCFALEHHLDGKAAAEEIGARPIPVWQMTLILIQMHPLLRLGVQSHFRGCIFRIRGCKSSLGGCKHLRLIKIFTEKLFCFGNTYNLKHIFTAIASKNNVSTASITVSVAAHSN